MLVGTLSNYIRLEITLGQSLYELVLQISTTTIKLSKIMLTAIKQYKEKE